MGLFCSGPNALSEEPDMVTEKNMPILIIKFLNLPVHSCGIIRNNDKDTKEFWWLR